MYKAEDKVLLYLRQKLNFYRSLKREVGVMGKLTCPSCKEDENIKKMGFYCECENCGFRGLKAKFVPETEEEENESFTISLEDTYLVTETKESLLSQLFSCWCNLKKTIANLKQIQSLAGIKVNLFLLEAAASVEFRTVTLNELPEEVKRYRNVEKVVAMLFTSAIDFKSALVSLASMLNKGDKYRSMVADSPTVNDVQKYAQYLANVAEASAKLLKEFEEAMSLC